MGVLPWVETTLPDFSHVILRFCDPKQTPAEQGVPEAGHLAPLITGDEVAVGGTDTAQSCMEGAPSGRTLLGAPLSF